MLSGYFYLPLKPENLYTEIQMPNHTTTLTVLILLHQMHISTIMTIIVTSDVIKNYLRMKNLIHVQTMKSWYEWKGPNKHSWMQTWNSFSWFLRCTRRNWQMWPCLTILSDKHGSQKPYKILFTSYFYPWKKEIIKSEEKNVSKNQKFKCHIWLNWRI